MRIGLDLYTIGHLDASIDEALAFAAARGLDGVQVLEPRAIDPGLDPARLAAFRERAAAVGLAVEVGLPSPNPHGLLSPPEAPADPAARADWFRPQLEAVAALGLPHARAFVAARHDRFRVDPPWTEQRRATAAVLRAMRADLLRLGLRLAIETHADQTADEILDLIAEVGDDVLGVTLDLGNLPMRLDDPLDAAERLAPHVLMTHAKDCALTFSPRGLRWQARPLGEGCVPVPEILSILRRASPDLMLSIELHPRTYDLPIFDPSWLAYFPGLRPSSLAAVVRLAADCERRYADGTMPRPEAVEAIPWPERAEAWIERSATFLRGIISDRPPVPGDLGGSPAPDGAGSDGGTARSARGRGDPGL